MKKQFYVIFDIAQLNGIRFRIKSIYLDIWINTKIPIVINNEPFDIRDSNDVTRVTTNWICDDANTIKVLKCFASIKLCTKIFQFSTRLHSPASWFQNYYFITPSYYKPI